MRMISKLPWGLIAMVLGCSALTQPPLGSQERVRESLITRAAPAPWGSMIILGHTQGCIAFPNFRNAKQYAVKQAVLPAPPGTTDAAAALRGFMLLFGKFDSIGESDCVVDPGRLNDHHLGFEYVNVVVTDIRANEVVIEARGKLSDYNADDRWTGVIVYDLLFLGPHP